MIPALTAYCLEYIRIEYILIPAYFRGRMTAWDFKVPFKEIPER